MKKNLNLIVAATLCLFTGDSLAQFDLSIDGMNANIEKCYRQTVLVAQKPPVTNVQTAPCTRVINNNWSSEKNTSVALLNRGIVYQFQGDTQKAIKDFKRSLTIKPEHHQAHVALAQILYHEQDFIASLSHYDKAISMHSNSALLHNREIVAAQIKRENKLKLAQKSLKHHTKPQAKSWD